MVRFPHAGRRRLTSAGGTPLSTAGRAAPLDLLAGRPKLSLTLAFLTAVAASIALLVLLLPAHRTGGAAATSAQASRLSPIARLAVSRGLGADLPGYRLSRTPGGFLAHNARQGLTAGFGVRGATVSARDGSRVIVALQAMGFGEALRPAGAARPLARGNRVEYRRTGATEWFANGPAGVEQGFTIATKPAGVTSDGALTLALDLSGTLTAHPGADGGLVLSGAGGKAILSYGDLSVTDAGGRSLPAHMTVERGRVLISVEDARAARYPLTVDPLLSAAELYASSGKENEGLGYSVAVSGKTVVAGTAFATVGGHEHAGDAYVFTEGVNGWSTSPQATELLPSTSETDAGFGYSVAISGKTIVVGAPDAAGIDPDNGAAFVFTEPEGGWSSTPEQHQAGKLVDTEDQAFPEFGKSVAVSGETVVVGSPRYVNYIYRQTTFREHPETGAAFVFVQPAGGWSKGAPEQVQSFTLMETEKEYLEYEEDDFFGVSVAIEERDGEQTVAVMAPDAKVDGHFEQGAAFIFMRPPGGWTGSLLESSPGAKLTLSNGVNYDRIGEAEVFSEGRTLAISGDEIVVGAPEVADGANEGEGAAYVFNRPSGGWASQPEQAQAATLLPSDGEKDWHFGKAVAAEGATVMIAGHGNGYVYSMPLGGWDGELQESSELVGSTTSVALTDGNALVGDTALSPPEGTGHAAQGGVLIVPLGPIVTTGSSSGLSTSTATVEGSVAPNRNAVSKCSFQYGTSTFYGAEAPCAQTVAGTGSSPTAVSAALTGLTPGTTYHYRAIARNADGTSYGEDETFTTAAAPAGGGETSPKTGTSTTITTTTTETPQPSPILACTTAQVALINVVQKGTHVLITGAARLVLAGKQVSIKLLATRKTVATATIAKDGTFTASAPLPPAKIRGSNLARYEAVVGSLHSLNLKLERRMYMIGATRSGAHVLISGYVTGSFKAGTAVKILLRVTCSKEEVVAKVKLTRSGKFSATVPAPTGAASQIAVYRASTTVLDDGHPEATFTLPTPPNA
jgi:hypothetical protein